MKVRRQFVAANESLSMRRQCEILGINRSSLYYESVGPDSDDLALMRRIDELHLKLPFYGSRRVARELRSQGSVNRKRVQRLMRLMGLVAIYQRPNTSKAAPEHIKYPYLLGGLTIDRVNQVWCTDITYIPLARGFLYLVAIMDWHSRAVLAWRLSNTLHADFCVEALEEALRRFGRPEIFNTDQGSQFTSNDFTGVLKKSQIKISMDGKGRCMDNIFVERLWRSLKYEEVYLHAYDNLVEARAGIRSYFEFYNSRRQHKALGHQTPARFYDGLVNEAA